MILKNNNNFSILYNASAIFLTLHTKGIKNAIFISKNNPAFSYSFYDNFCYICALCIKVFKHTI